MHATQIETQKLHVRMVLKKKDFSQSLSTSCFQTLHWTLAEIITDFLIRGRWTVPDTAAMTDCPNDWQRIPSQYHKPSRFLRGHESEFRLKGATKNSEFPSYEFKWNVALLRNICHHDSLCIPAIKDLQLTVN